MALTLVTAPAGDPVSLAEVKAHLRVDVDDENALIGGLITAAGEYVENFTRRALLTQTWDDKRDGFPLRERFADPREAIVLPKPPVASVTSVTYTATDGTSTVWSSSLYTTELPVGAHAQPGQIWPAYGEYYPTTRSVRNAVTVRFVCGYGAASDVPASLKAAMLLLIGHWYANREAVNVGDSVTPVPMAVDALLWPFYVS